jgi:NADH dehydrogenase
MKIAITGATGFVGWHLAQELSTQGHSLVLISRGRHHNAADVSHLRNVTFVHSDLSDCGALIRAFADCDAIAHCAGINREIGRQTYARVHVEGTRNVVEAAQIACVPRIALISFLRARPNCGSPYHESKWAAEQAVAGSGLDFTILRPGVIYGRGDHMLDHLSHGLYALPFLPTVGFQPRPLRPLAVEDLTRILVAVLVEGRLSRKTVAVTGPEELLLADAARRVAHVLGRRLVTFPLPVWFHLVVAAMMEQTMKIPLVVRAQVRILAEGVAKPALPCDLLPADLAPRLRFTEEQIRRGLPEPGPFTIKDLRSCGA